MSDFALIGDGDPWTPERQRSQDEWRLQRSVVTFLRNACPDGVTFSVPNEGLRTGRAGGRFKQAGMLAGMPDLCLIWRGRAYFIELKAGRRGPTVIQRHVHDLLTAAEAVVLVARSLDEVERGLREAGVRLRATCLAG